MANTFRAAPLPVLQLLVCSPALGALIPTMRMRMLWRAEQGGGRKSPCGL